MASPSHARSKVGGWPLAVAIAVVLAFLFFTREILLPFVLAAAISFILTPVIDRIEERLGIRRWIAAVAAYLAILAFFGLLGYWAGGLVIRQVAEIVHQFPQLIHKLVTDFVAMSGGFIGQTIDPDALAKGLLAQIEGLFRGSAIIVFAGYGMSAVLGTVLVVVLLIYFLVSGRRLAEGVFWLIPPEYRDEVGAVTAKILPMLWRYFVGLVAVVAYTTTAAWIGFGSVFHLPYAALLAIVVGLLELIPVIGPATSIGIAVLAALQQNSLGAVAGVAVFAIALRLSIDQIIGPLVLGRAAHLHPVVIIFAFLAGAVLFGIIGLLLAVPFAAAVKIVLTTYYAEPVRETARAPPDPARPAAASATAWRDPNDPCR